MDEVCKLPVKVSHLNIIAREDRDTNILTGAMRALSTSLRHDKKMEAGLQPMISSPPHELNKVIYIFQPG